MGAIAGVFLGATHNPSSEIAEIMAVELPKVGGKFIQMEDEIATSLPLLVLPSGYKA